MTVITWNMDMVKFDKAKRQHQNQETDEKAQKGCQESECCKIELLENEV